jgi:hypothetical protein
MKPIDLTGIVEDFPVCPVCGFPMQIDEQVSLATAEGLIFLVHYACADIEFFNA